METQKGSGYTVEHVLLMESHANRIADIIFDAQNPINHQVNVETEAQETADNGRFGVSLTVTLKAVQNENVVYDIRAQMIGVFTKAEDAVLPEEVFKKVNAPAIIYPFIREHISSITLKAGLGNFLLPPVNFKV